ncbi:MAG: hypothetical protein IPM38_03595 [Ignavibacteria bacterium]|nr:hypothetical protein [Ignavibacteria bacterium]
MILRFVFLVLIFGFISNIAYPQFFPRFSLAGGPTVGWQYQNVDDLNAQMVSIGVPEFPKDGFLTLGGGGFIELPIKGIDWLRIGGSGTGFTYERNITDQNNLSKTVIYSFGAGGVSFDYVKTLGKTFDLTFGAFLSTGNLTIQIYQNTTDFGNWNNIFGEVGSGASSNNISRKLTKRFYSAQPQIGIGFFVTKYLYAKLNTGYLFSVSNDWKVDNDIPVTNAPEGIKADGFNINFGLNFGLFTK